MNLWLRVALEFLATSRVSHMEAILALAARESPQVINKWQKLAVGDRHDNSVLK